MMDLSNGQNRAASLVQGSRPSSVRWSFFFIANANSICSSPTGAFMVAIVPRDASYAVTRHVPMMALVTASSSSVRHADPVLHD